MQTEYVRNLNSNYERLLLDKAPEDKRYQYCILSRGGIKGLLPCNMRYINGVAYLYYDITSKQNISRLFAEKKIDRKWMRDFLWSMRQIQRELGRFLLDTQNILWQPEQIFQDLEKNQFSFLYIPYYEGENGFMKLLEFWVERIDYEDEGLVEYVYKMHEQFERLGKAYLQQQIFEDSEMLNEMEKGTADKEAIQTENYNSEMNREEISETPALEEKQSKKSILSIWDGRKKRQREIRGNYQKEIRLTMEGRAVCEGSPFEEEKYEKEKHEKALYAEEDYGKTIYIEETGNIKNRIRCLFDEEGRTAVHLTKLPLRIGKKAGEVDFVVADSSISRIHARIWKEEDIYYLEDMNSTNGTFKNGLRMLPYERRVLEEGDEVRFGKVTFLFR